jgi:nickel superoxide dismutase
VIPSLPRAAEAPAEPAPVHCQVPCGIYGDLMRIDMLMEDAQTIEKGMAQVLEMEAAEKPNYNQIVRWITTKDDHAQHIQDMAGDYWFAQRIKAPAADADEAAGATYDSQLRHMHGIMTSAMKCKQTTDAANVDEDC